MGFLRKTAPSDDLVTTGIRGTATVEHVEQPRFGMELSLGRGSADKLLSGEETATRKKARLRVELPGREPYVVETKIAVPMLESNWLSAGATVTVLVDPDDPSRLAVDWKAGHEQGKVSDSLADSPLAMQALQGLGIDLGALEAQADAAQKLAQQYLQAQQQPPAPAGPSEPSEA